MSQTNPITHSPTHSQMILHLLTNPITHSPTGRLTFGVCIMSQTNPLTHSPTHSLVVRVYVDWGGEDSWCEDVCYDLQYKTTPCAPCIIIKNRNKEAVSRYHLLISDLAWGAGMCGTWPPIVSFVLLFNIQNNDLSRLHHDLQCKATPCGP